MYLSTIAQMRQIDKLTIEEYNIPGIILMENAGKAVADRITVQTNGRVLVICGKGNNGGDGSVVARHLHCMGRAVTLTYVALPMDGDAKTAYEMAKSVGVKIADWSASLLDACEVVVDAILGIGANGTPSPEISDVITAVNSSMKSVFSVDVPTGGNADNGQISGECIRADCTVTFGLCKVGLMCYPLHEYAGEIIIEDISFAPDAIKQQNIVAQAIGEISLPALPPSAHKGTNGSVFVVAGSIGMTGAAYLNCMAAMRAGCGKVTLGIPSSLNAVMEQKLTEVMTLPLDETDGHLAAAATKDILSASDKYDVLLCGSGLSQNSDIKKIITHLITESKLPLVIDADGLNVLSDIENDANLDLLKGRDSVVITPHIGEMARLINKSTQYVAGNTVEVAKDFAREYDVTVVLKSAHTVIAAPNGEVYISTVGNPGMATAGSGDVLAGIIAAFVAQGMGPTNSAVFGVKVHSDAGDSAAKRVGARTMIATDMLIYGGLTQ